MKKFTYRGYTVYLHKEDNKKWSSLRSPKWYYSIIGPEDEDYGMSTSPLSYRQATIDSKITVDDLIEEENQKFERADRIRVKILTHL